MPTIKVRIPLPTHPPLARRRGVGEILTQQPVYLPGPNVFTRGLGAIMIRQPVVLPGPNIFKGLAGLRRRGVGCLHDQSLPRSRASRPQHFCALREREKLRHLPASVRPARVGAT